MDRNSALKSAAAYAKEVCGVLSPLYVILYGSYTHGTPTQESDIDIAVVFDGYNGNWLKDSALLWQLTRNVSTLIEPVILDRKNDPSGFVEQVIKTGEVLYTTTS